LEATKEKRPRIKLWAAAAVLVILVAGLIAFRGSGQSGVQRQIAAIRKAGLPASSADLDRWYERPAPSNNAALLVVDAAREHVTIGGILGSFPAAGEALSPEMKKAIIEHIDENREVLQKLHVAARLEESRYPINLNVGVNTLLPHLAQVKGMTQTLRYDAMLHGANNDPERAVHSIDTSFALARTLRNEPLLISELVRIACVAISLQSFEWLLSEQPLEASQLAEVDRRLEQAEEDGRRDIFRAMAGERAGAIEYFLTSWPGLTPPPGGGPNLPPLQTVGIGVFKMLGLRDRDLRLYLESMEEFVAVSTNDFPRMLRAGEVAEKESMERMSHGLARLAVMTRMTIPAITRSFSKEVSLATRLRSARVAIAVERYRLAHNGGLPEGLDSLMPEIWAKPMVDPVFMNPFEFESSPTNAFRVAGKKPTNIFSSPIVYQIYSSAAGRKLSNNLANAFVVRR
jgi:hypothetical protein